MIFKTNLLFLFLSCVLVLQGQTIIWDINQIYNTKLQQCDAVISLIKEADKMLKAELVTVVDKPMVPASGSKHDYMSMGRYWWPNPATSDGLPYVRKDGVVNPEIEKLDRYPLAKFGRSISVLSLAFHLTGKEMYAVKAVSNLKKWFVDEKTRMNPNMNFGQTIPGHNNGKGRGEGVLDTYSFVEVLEGVELLKNSSKYTKALDQSLKQWFQAYLKWMLTSEIGQEEYRAKNNHGVAFDVQVVRYAIFVGDQTVALKFVNEFAANRIFKQIEPDGSQPLELARTTAFGYSVFNLGHLIDMCSLAKHLQVDVYNSVSNDGRSISKAIDFLLPYVSKPQSSFPYPQIRDWDKVQGEICWVLKRADKFNSTPKYVHYYNHLLKSDPKNENSILY